MSTAYTFGGDPYGEVFSSRPNVGDGLSRLQAKRGDHPIRHLPSIPSRVIERLRVPFSVGKTVLQVIGLLCCLSAGPPRLAVILGVETGREHDRETKHGEE